MDIIYKKLKFSEIFLNKNLKFWCYNKNNALILIFILSLSKVNITTKKKLYKKYNLFLEFLLFWNNFYITNKSDNNLYKSFLNKYLEI